MAMILQNYLQEVYPALEMFPLLKLEKGYFWSDWKVSEILFICSVWKRIPLDTFSVVCKLFAEIWSKVPTSGTETCDRIPILRSETDIEELSDCLCMSVRADACDAFIIRI